MFCYYFFYAIIRLINCLEVKSMGKHKCYKWLLGSFIFFIAILIVEPVFAISCNGILTADAAAFIQKIIDGIRILAPILLIILGSIDLGQAVISEDKDSLKKATSRLIKRAIAALAIFFIPLVVRVLLDISGITGTLVDDPMCAIDEGGGK